MRVDAQRSDSGDHMVSSQVENLVAQEISVGMTSIDFYEGFQDRSEEVKNYLVACLIEQEKVGQSRGGVRSSS